MMFDQILNRLVPGAEFRFGTIEELRMSRKAGDKVPVERLETITVYDNYDSIIWEDRNTAKPTLAVCESEWAIIRKERSNEGIDELRRDGYGSIESQLEMQFDDMRDGTTKWYDHITSVKEQYPKDVV